MLQTVLAQSAGAGTPGPKGDKGADGAPGAAGYLAPIPGNLSVSGKSLVGLIPPPLNFATAPTFVTSGQKFGTGAMSNSIGTSTGVLPTSLPFSRGIWFSFPANPSAFQIVTGQNRVFYIGIQPDGTLKVGGGGANGTTEFAITSSAALSLNAMHFATLSVDANTITVTLDGAVVGSVSNTTQFGLTATGTDGNGKALGRMAIGSHGGYESDFAFTGLIDESSTWNIAKWTAAFTPPTAPYVGNEAGLVGLFHFDGDAANYAVGATGVATVLTDTVDGVTLVGGGSVPLSAPMLTRTVPISAMPKDGTAFDSQINAFITDAKAKGFSMARLGPGWAKVYNAVKIPSSFDLVADGQHDDAGAGYYGGGTKLEVALNANCAAVSMVGAGNTNGTADNYVYSPGLHGICVTGTKSVNTALSGYQPALIECINVYHFRGSYLSGGNDFFCFLRAKSMWDSDIYEIKINNGGFCDVTADPTTDAVKAYTGRSAAMAVETAVGHSLGVPAVDLWSDDPAGQAVTNNLRIYSMHIESNAEGGVPLMVHGANTGSVSVIGSKIECAEGPTPMIVLDSAHGFYYQGWLYASGTGYPYATIGGVPSGTAWNTYPISGALMLACDSYNPQIIANGGYGNGGNSGQPDSFFRFVRCSNPQVNFGIEDGLNRVTAARVILDACQNVNPYKIHTPSAAYVPGSSARAFQVLNGTTLNPNLQSITAGGATFLAMPWPPA